MNVDKLFLLILIFFVLSCKQGKELSNNQHYDFSEDSIANQNKVRQIFYSMYLPNEMSRLFERVGANYDPSILNSTENFARYTQTVDLALNLGIYGVDLNYVRMFDQGATMAKYFGIIQLMADKLGIPKSSFEKMMLLLL